MDAHVKDIVREMSKASDEERVTFPAVVKALMEVKIERYHADLVTGRKTYYLADGDFEDVEGHKFGGAAMTFSARRRGEGGPRHPAAGDRLSPVLPPDRRRGLRRLFCQPRRPPRGLLWPHRGRARRMVSRRQALKASPPAVKPPLARGPFPCSTTSCCAPISSTS